MLTSGIEGRRLLQPLCRGREGSPKYSNGQICRIPCQSETTTDGPVRWIFRAIALNIDTENVLEMQFLTINLHFLASILSFDGSNLAK
jgi:hypothetical protein